MNTREKVQKQAKTPAAPESEHAGQPPMTILDREAERPAIATQLECVARLGHSLGGIRVDGSAPPIIQRQELPEEEELQMQRETAAVQRQEAPEEEEEEIQMQREPAAVQRQEMPEDEEDLQMKPDRSRVGPEGGPVPPYVEAAIQRARGSGQPLDGAVQAEMGKTLGHDFSAVRVHTDGEADALNRQLSAKAFTTGHDIFFRQGEYHPGYGGGQELIAHELCHVVQQCTGSSLGGSNDMNVRPAGDRFEYEAVSVAPISQPQFSAIPLGAVDADGTVDSRRPLDHLAIERWGDVQRQLEWDPPDWVNLANPQLIKASVMAAYKQAKGLINIAVGENRQERRSMWFGAAWQDPAVTTTLSAVQAALSAPLTVHPQNTPPPGLEEAYAWANRGRRGEFWIKPSYFMEANSQMIDKAGGIMIHELSHSEADTLDYEYGPINCMDLARRDPTAAIKNADNYEYFCESATEKELR
jgi:hypothetical protein